MHDMEQFELAPCPNALPYGHMEGQMVCSALPHTCVESLKQETSRTGQSNFFNCSCPDRNVACDAFWVLNLVKQLLSLPPHYHAFVICLLVSPEKILSI